ncbi:MAG: MliC family protein [Burkholderiaceae bacterium]|jgi:membrane-bound inhibitor of C-type lysozyme|nr:MliC family protein [Burkholderiaceae bacterium]
MKRLSCILVLLLAACGTLPDSGKSSSGESDRTSASSGFNYICDSGARININYQENGLLLRYKGKTHRLKAAVSASGARYAGDGLVWWNKGKENTLFKLTGTDDTGDALESCKEVKRKKQATR